MNGAAAIRTKPNLTERAVFARHWVENMSRIGWMALRNGPYDMARDLSHYSWLWQLLRVNELLARFTAGRVGLYQKASAELVTQLTAAIIDCLEAVYFHSDTMILHEDLVPPEIFYGMGLDPWMAELLGIVVPLIDSSKMETFVDVCENEGIPGDVCSLPKATIGLTLAGQMPPPVAIVASNQPCDGGMSSYSVMERTFKVPTFRLDTPYNFHDERAVDYFVGELKRMIVWLEQHTPGRMDWDRMREICERRNRMRECELEIWDMLRAKPAPLAGETIYLSHLMFAYARPGTERGVKLFERLLEFARQIQASGTGAVPGERYRVALWNPPTLVCPDLHVWAERTYRAVTLMDQLSYSRQGFIDTSTPETMLRSLAGIIMEGPMSRHTRGPAENFFGDLFHLYEYFNLDMIWMAGHIGCKNTQALLGMFREKCRRRDIPLLIIDYDLLDSRIVSQQGVQRQVEQFMETVIGAERFDG